MRVLGIDPGSLVTGYGCVDFDGGRARLVSAGVIRCSGKPLPPRLLTILSGVRKLIDELRPDQVAIEEVFVNRNVRSALVLGHARGAAICAMAAAGLEVHEYAPTRIKSAVVGTGRAEKSQVQHMVRVILAINDDLQSDAADALAVAICHAHYHAPRLGKPRGGKR